MSEVRIVQTNGAIRVPRHVQHFDARAQHGDPFGQLGTVQMRHDDVGQQQVDRDTVVRSNAQGIVGVHRLDHAVALLLEHAAHELSHGRLVFHQIKRGPVLEITRRLGARP